MNRTVVVSAMLIALVASTVAGAPTKTANKANRGASGPGFDASLLQMDQVQKELQLTEEQRTKLLMIGMQMLQTGKRGNLEKQVNMVLKPEQRQRLKEIRLQLDGVSALLNPKIGKELNLDADQIAKLRAIQTSVGSAPSAKAGADQYLKLLAARKEATAKALEVLTPEQRKKFEKMQGKKVEFELPATNASKSKAK